MDSAGAIKLLTPHLNSDTKPLHDLVTAHSNNVDTDNALLGTHADQLVHGRLLVLLRDHREVQGTEGRLVCKCVRPIVLSTERDEGRTNFHRVITILFPGFWLS